MAGGAARPHCTCMPGRFLCAHGECDRLLSRDHPAACHAGAQEAICTRDWQSPSGREWAHHRGRLVAAPAARLLPQGPLSRMQSSAPVPVTTGARSFVLSCQHAAARLTRLSLALGQASTPPGGFPAEPGSMQAPAPSVRASAGANARSSWRASRPRRAPRRSQNRPRWPPERPQPAA